MNIGEIRKNANGQLIGSVETLTITRTIGLRPVTSQQPARAQVRDRRARRPAPLGDRRRALRTLSRN